jgi:hypothetical protein
MKTEAFLSDMLNWSYDEIVSPQEFLDLCANHREQIDDVEFLLPGVGPYPFGSFAVGYVSRHFKRK